MLLPLYHHMIQDSLLHFSVLSLCNVCNQLSVRLNDSGLSSNNLLNQF